MREKAIFAAGCFWGVEEHFRNITGVIETKVGYTGGNIPDPTYKMVCTGTTGHAEAVEVTFDPDKVSYEELLDQFWQIHDPTLVDRQGPNVGSQYRSAIFFVSEKQKRIIAASKSRLRFKNSIVTEVASAGPFYLAEGYHQCYLEKQKKRF